MNKKEHDKAVESLKEICREIGCSGLSPAMCDYAPQMCSIIRKLVIPNPTETTQAAQPSGRSNASRKTLPFQPL